MPGKNKGTRSLAAVFRLLGDPTRLGILMLLDKGEMNVGEICRKLGLSQPTASHHLAILRTGELVSARRCGKEVYYSTGALSGGQAARAIRAAARRSSGLRLGPVVIQPVKALRRA